MDSTPGHVLVEVTIHSGKNRIVRRLFDAVGYPVERLVRVEMGPIRIGSQKQVPSVTSPRSRSVTCSLR